MIPTVAIPNIQMPSPVLPASFEGAPSQTGMARLPFYAVPSAMSSPEAYNNTKAVVQSNAGVAASAAAAVAPASSGSISSSLFGNLLSPSTSLFMTQVMGQSSGGNGSLVQSFFSSFAPSSPAPTAETMERFARSKFLPSDASKPMPTPTGVSNIKPLNSASSAPSRASVAQATQQLAQVQVTNVRSLNVQPAANSNVGAVSTTQVNNTPAERTVTTRPNTSDRAAPSLVRPQGFNAYQATLSRNVANLDEISEEPVRVTL